MSDIDLSVADSAYATLLDARHKPRNIAADLARPLMNETENLGVRSHEIEIMEADALTLTNPMRWCRSSPGRMDRLRDGGSSNETAFR
jgi:hypothetical protein